MNGVRVMPVVLIGLVVIGFAYWANTGRVTPYAEAAAIADGVTTFAELSKRFTDLAHDKGAAYAFEVLKRADIPPNTDLHLLAHSVGEILYQQSGVEGIADCTQEFRNACSHSVVIGALNDFGEAALSDIRDACKKAPGGSGAYTMCYHGLGHGVFAYFQYDLAHTADLCKKTGTPEYNNREYIECVGGAIMELMGGGGHNRDAWLAARTKYLDDARPLSPCMDGTVPAETKEICLTYLTPRLWELAGINMGSPDPTRFPVAFSYCEEIPQGEKKLRAACYGGFGKEFLPLTAMRDIRDDVEYSDEQLGTVGVWCEYAGEDGKNACIADAVASAFWGGEKEASTAFRLCAAAPTSMQRACYVRLMSEIVMYTESPRRDELCAQIPESFRNCGNTL